ncbi:MAG: hypothetical protein QXR30_04195, partial [Candidatus Woesearchaeota archaeon]
METNEIDQELERLKNLMNNIEAELFSKQKTVEENEVEEVKNDSEEKKDVYDFEVKKQVLNVPKDYDVYSLSEMIEDLNEKDNTEVALKKKINQLLIENKLLKEKMDLIVSEMKLKEDTLNKQFNRFIETQKEFYQMLDELKIKEEELKKLENKLNVREEMLNQKLALKE